MKDKNCEKLAKQLTRTGKVAPVAATIIFSALLSGLAIAEPGSVENPTGQEVILENPDSGSLALESQQLSLDALSATPGTVLTLVDEPEEATDPVPTQLALANHTVRNGSSITGMVEEQAATDAGSVESAGGESPQKPYALILALVALISLVPMSRRHQ